ncbi:hypothetical protein EGLA_12010 [Enterococcus gallinarum]|nr:hypothetical protein AH4_06930 [Enterococcus gallinarum]
MIGDKGKEARVHHVFERVAENYDQMNTVISFQQHKRWRKDTMKRMQVQAGNDILDVCCGKEKSSGAKDKDRMDARKCNGTSFCRQYV